MTLQAIDAGIVRRWRLRSCHRRSSLRSPSSRSPAAAPTIDVSPGVTSLDRQMLADALAQSRSSGPVSVPGGPCIALEDHQAERDASRRAHDLSDDAPDVDGSGRTDLVLLLLRLFELSRRDGRARGACCREQQHQAMRFCGIADIMTETPRPPLLNHLQACELLKLNEIGVPKGWQLGEKRLAGGKAGIRKPDQSSRDGDGGSERKRHDGHQLRAGRVPARFRGQRDAPAD